MKLLKAKIRYAVAGVAILSFLGSAGVAFASMPSALIVSHRDSTDTATTTSYVSPDAFDDGAEHLLTFTGAGGTDGTFRYLDLGSGIGISGDIIFVTPNSIETPDGHLTDTLALKANASTVTALAATVAGLGTPLNIGAFMANQASTTPLIATSTFNGFMSGAMVTKLAALSTTTPRSMATTTRSIVTSTGAVGTQLSTTRDAEVHYSGTIVTTATISGPSLGTLVLEAAPTNSATAGDWSEVGRCTNGQNITLAVALNSVQTIACQLNGYVPAGWYEKIRSISTSGTPTFALNSSQEVLLS